jgi:DNA-binding response OmpR family regulator
VAKRRVLLVDDEVAILLTMKAVLELNGFEVETAASAREARSKIKLYEYQMVMTDMRMENDAAGREVIQAARTAAYHPAVALLTAFPEDDWSEMGADQMLVKPMQTALLVKQIEKLLDSHSAKLTRLAGAAAAPSAAKPAKAAAKKVVAKKSAAKRLASKKLPIKKIVKQPVARKKVSTKKRKR